MTHHLRLNTDSTWSVVRTTTQNIAAPGRVIATFALDAEADAGRLLHRLNNQTAGAR